MKKMENISDKERRKVLEVRALNKAGFGQHQNHGNKTSGFDVVSAADTKKSDRLLPIMDSRRYDSENEDYDIDDYAKTLALGTMMLRKKSSG
jgi:hypothetical protein